MCVTIFIGMTAGPLVAKRMRRTCGMSSSALPMSSMFLGAQLVGVAAGDDDVLELRPLRNVLERVLPLLGRLGQRDFVHVLGVGADRIAARAEAAVDRADVERKKECFIHVAVHEAGNRRIFLFVQRIERQARMIGQQR